MAESMTSILDRMDNMDNPSLLAWNKLEKAFKLQKLNEFAERFAQEKALLPEQRQQQPLPQHSEAGTAAAAAAAAAAAGVCGVAPPRESEHAQQL
jgi:hypothetical protein